MPTTELDQQRTANTGSGAQPVAAPTPDTVVLPSRDVRAKRPPALSFVLRMETLRRIARVASLLALDFAGVFLAIFTALIIKAAARDAVDWSAAWHETLNTIWFAYLVTVLLFARSDLYAVRAARPGLSRIVACLFQVTVVALIFAVVNGEQYSSYYIFYGSLFFAVVYISSAALGLREAHRRDPRARRATAGARCSSARASRSRRWPTRCRDTAHAQVDMVGYISLTPRPDNGLRSLGRIEDLPRVLDEQRVQEVIIADPDFPQARRSSSSTSATSAA